MEMTKHREGNYDYDAIQYDVHALAVANQQKQKEALMWLQNGPVIVCNSQGRIKWNNKVPQCTLRQENDKELHKKSFRTLTQGDLTPMLYLEGGYDVDPVLYNEPNRYCGAVYRKLDLIEMSMIEAAIELELPIFANCRGHQLLTAYLGGKLYQDIHTELGRPHKQEHPVTLFNDMVPYAIEHGFGHEHFVVNSTHHQAVKLAHHSGRVCAMHSDGTCEMIYYPNVRAFSTQHHPELLDDYVFLAWVLQNLLNVQ